MKKDRYLVMSKRKVLLQLDVDPQASSFDALVAIDAGVDAVDAAMDAMSGLTSQPPLGSICAALAHHERAPEIGRAHV